MKRIVDYIERNHISEEEVAKAAGIELTAFRKQIHAENELQPKVMRAIVKSQSYKDTIDSIFFDHLKYDPINLEGLTYDQLRDIIKLIHPNIYADHIKYHKTDYIDFNLRTDLGDRIRFTRDVILELSQINLAKRLNLDLGRNTVKYWDMGQINVDKIYSLSAYTNISMDFFLMDNHPLELHTEGIDQHCYKAILACRDLFLYRNSKK